MNRREFAAAMGSVMAALNLPAIAAPAHELAEQPPYEVEHPLRPDLIMLPVEGLQEVSVCSDPIDITSMSDSFKQLMPGPQYVQLLYVTQERIPELLDAIGGGEPCRLEAFGFRVDGYLEYVRATVGRFDETAGRFDSGVTTNVKMWPTGAIVYGEEYDHTKGRR